MADPLGVLVELFLAFAEAAVMLVGGGAGRGLAVAEATGSAALECLVRGLGLTRPVAGVLALFGFVAMLLLLRGSSVPRLIGSSVINGMSGGRA